MLNIVIYYDLLRNGDYETGSTDHKLIMEVIDPKREIHREDIDTSYRFNRWQQ